jgi:hypothetical protein
MNLNLFISLGLLLLGLIKTSEFENNTTPCGNYTCVIDQGKCILNGTDYFCLCSEYFDSYPQNGTLQCNYRKKKQYIAFFLETFLTYGAGHFYCENYQVAVPKLVYFVFCYCLFIYLRMLMKSKEDNNTAALIIALLACLFLTIMLAWQLADIILYALNSYPDGYNISLYPW